jgi:hypothetical protein
MATRRAVRSTRRDDKREFAEEEPEDEIAEQEPDEELVEEPEDEIAEEEPEDQPAEEEPEQASRDDSRGGSKPRSRRGAGLKAAKAGQLGRRQIAELTGKEPEGITGVERAEDGWIVGVEVVEDRRIPSSSDILATYETEIDMDGELVSYRRVRRYPRGRGDSEDS